MVSKARRDLSSCAGWPLVHRYTQGDVLDHKTGDSTSHHDPVKPPRLRVRPGIGDFHRGTGAGDVVPHRFP